MKFRKLRADEIDVRVASVTENGCSLLLYKDARVDQNILDETFGIFNWQRSHQLIGDRLYCTVSVKNTETGEWVSKQDVGTESFTEPEKGQASDSFKRACFNFGIGRELYTAPFVWVSADKCSIKAGKNGKPAVYDRFKVQDIGYSENGNINRLAIVNTSRKDEVVFTFGDFPKVTPTKIAKTPTKPVDTPKKTVEKIGDKKVITLKKTLLAHRIPEEVLLQRYKKKALADLTMDDWNDFCKTGKEFIEKWDKEHAA